MDLDTLLRAIEATSIATEIREGESSFPFLECVHVLAVTLVVGSVSIVDLRLLGWASLERAVPGRRYGAAGDMDGVRFCRDLGRAAVLIECHGLRP